MISFIPCMSAEMHNLNCVHCSCVNLCTQLWHMWGAKLWKDRICQPNVCTYKPVTMVEQEIPMGMDGLAISADSQPIVWHHLSWRETNVHLNVHPYKRGTQFGLNSATLPVDIRLTLPILAPYISTSLHELWCTSFLTPAILCLQISIPISPSSANDTQLVVLTYVCTMYMISS